jgi:hypothetical protein
MDRAYKEGRGFIPGCISSEHAGFRPCPECGKSGIRKSGMGWGPGVSPADDEGKIVFVVGGEEVFCLLTTDALTLLGFLVARSKGAVQNASARHDDRLDHIDDLRAAWEELYDRGLVEDDSTSWAPFRY